MDKVVGLAIVIVTEFIFMYSGVELYKAEVWHEPVKVALAMLVINAVLFLLAALVAYLNGDVKSVTKD